MEQIKCSVNFQTWSANSKLLVEPETGAMSYLIIFSAQYIYAYVYMCVHIYGAISYMLEKTGLLWLVKHMSLCPYLLLLIACCMSVHQMIDVLKVLVLHINGLIFTLTQLGMPTTRVWKWYEAKQNFNHRLRFTCVDIYRSNFILQCTLIIDIRTNFLNDLPCISTLDYVCQHPAQNINKICINTKPGFHWP